MDYTISELRKKRVISASNGKELGRVWDIVFKTPSYTVQSFIIADKKRFFSGEKYVLKVACIEKIGEDIILVRVDGKIEQKNCENLSDLDE